jgi:hypothetical protein
MTRPTTCGQGLAAHAPLPTILADLAAATADVLRAHLEMLDRTDPASEGEHGVYLHLIEAHRAVAENLRALGTEMAGYEALPMGRHRQNAEAARAMAEAFARFVEVERILAGLMRDRLPDDEAMLASM